ncbi:MULTISPECIES: Gfo/Idh/MocA family oxidoreductase [unclassified Lentimonas]|uniref:Gfo/Idh/MocA family oxidoreductase n=1 Tax=unclassified Lentimonas TaxID=2630993 RepID=UPI001320CA24|nr:MULTISPECIES: Gfo/Idh/MocA family oxidoreductase [unclassified Lentimonas]CAA6680188.1 putative dehydrogenase [Lentimonas sp. CC4]CAA6687058.1 putative dehydrogenase [Lentimonas sp. CC6]CAA7076168.1 putative dehydrogenase [Lentimonas sp. CC4]CAA7171183.1 putative dehydrogenase [Lentimonas sp. CC21]CAA7182764.1 putative dehydrogenase [Lentimonas sp. CC8]
MKHTSSPISRRSFVKASTAFATFAILPSYRSLGAVSPNEKIRLAVIGIGNQGNGVRRQLVGTGLCDVVALCDIDMEGKHTHLSRYQHGLAKNPPQGKNKEKVYPVKAKGYTDWRKMFDEMADDIDAVLIATPDHAHFCPTMLAMSLGKHVYVEKPLTHTFGQAERLMRMADKYPNIATQMGNQGHSGANYFQFKAWTEAGVIKDITRVTASMNYKRRWHGWGPSADAYPTQPVPKGVDWEFWHDCVAADRPFSDKLHPGAWRGWYEFGSGCFGDWGPHILDTPHRFLELGLPHTIHAEHLAGVNPYDLVYPEASTIKFQFAARGAGKPACDVTWYDGFGNNPVLEGEYTEDGKPLKLKDAGKVLYSKDLVFKGGHHGQPLQIVPRAKYREMHDSLPEFSQKNSNHAENFLLACKGEEVARSPFRVGGELTQVFALGMLAQRFGGTLEFDTQRKQITNNKVANALIDPAPRSGWKEYYDLWT